MFSQLDELLAISFRYPRHNFNGIRSRAEHRKLLIQRVRHLDMEPLHESTVPSQPLLRRGHTLVTGIDLDKGEQRSFYYESMEEVEVLGECKEGKHRVYVFDPSGELPPALAYATDNIAQAWLWVQRWEDDHQGHTAVLWPVGVAPPVAIAPRHA